MKINILDIKKQFGDNIRQFVREGEHIEFDAPLLVSTIVNLQRRF